MALLAQRPDNLPCAPRVIAMLLCDAVYIEPVTSKPTILGVHDQVAAPAFPATIRLNIFAALTEIYGQTTIRAVVRPLDGEDQPPVLELNVRIDTKGPAHPAWAVIDCGEPMLPRPGMYIAELWWGDELIGQIPLQVVQS
jgi:hypothetical protein